MKQSYVYAIIIISFFALGAFFLFSQTPSSESSINSNSSHTSQTPVQSAVLSATTMPSPMETKKVSKPEMTLDLKKSYSAVLHTSAGNITISFDTKNTPITSNNFIYLARNHFYDNTIFHRVIDGFMIQGGDPEGTGAGGPGYQFNDEYLKGNYSKGTVAMANAGPNTNGSQFFIMHDDNDLPNNYVIFGHVESGMDVVDKIATAPVTYSLGGEKSKPVSPVSISSVDILEK